MASKVNILAIETSSHACSVALQYNGTRQALHRVAPMQQTHLILPMIDELLKTAKLTLQQFDAIAFGAGPGSFTGMRIASSVTQGLAFSSHLRVISVSSLAAIAQTAHMTTAHKTTYLVALDARMGQVYWAQYAATNGSIVQLIGQEKLCVPSSVSVEGSIQMAVGLGDGWAAYPAELAGQINQPIEQIINNQLPSAAAVLELALHNVSTQNTLSATQALPVYLKV